MMVFFMGFDVGTESVRAAIVDGTGNLLKSESHPIEIWKPQPEFYEQSSNNIWKACCICSKKLNDYIAPHVISGIGFTATCSLVVLDASFKPLPVSHSDNSEQNVIMWLDHRAYVEAAHINSQKHEVLKFVGGSISIEMQPPKLLWLKKNMPETWRSAAHFMDLPDFLTWRATGWTSRSLCSAVCKWTYQAKDMARNEGWDDQFWKSIGLDDILENNYSRIGTTFLEPGSPVGCGLSQEGARELGLLPQTPVGASVIDAYAGALGLFACTTGIESQTVDTSRLALICGTSTCIMANSKQPIFAPGIWGPYHSVMFPGLWTNEGGQSATGKLLDHVIRNHPAYPTLTLAASSKIFEELDEILQSQQRKLKLPSVAHLTSSLHIFPDFHGNRSPLADPNLKGMISGLTLNVEEDNLAELYLATIQSLAYEMQFIVSVLEKSGHSFSSILMCGGLSKNLIFIQTLADVTGLNVIQPVEKESVLLGAAILGAKAADCFVTDIQVLLKRMGGTGIIHKPKEADKLFHEKKYQVFLKMLEDQKEYQVIMSGTN